MTFVPIYNAKFIEPIVTNIHAYLENNEEAAFTALGFELEKTKVWRESRWYNTLFPVTSVIPARTTPEEAEDRSRITQTHLILLEVELDGNNPDTLAKAAMRRIAAYDALLRAISKQQLLNGLNLGTAGDEWLDIGDHDYNYFARETSLYKVTASTLLTIHVVEGRNVGS